MGHVTDGSVAHAHCIPDTQVCKHILRICNPYCFSAKKVVPRTRLNVTLYIHSGVVFNVFHL
jgi:hypothetical protein